jgi:hypothetical protein
MIEANWRTFVLPSRLTSFRLLGQTPSGYRHGHGQHDARGGHRLLRRRAVRHLLVHGVEYVQISTGEGPFLVFQPVPEPRSVKNRLQLDLAPAASTQEAEVDRFVDLGATRMADEPELPWVVLADPEGNEFCVLPPGGDLA